MRKGYTYEETAWLLNIYFDWSLDSMCLHSARDAIKELWVETYRRESPTVNTEHQDLRSKLGILRVNGMRKNGSLRIEREVADLPFSSRMQKVYLDSYLPLVPLDSEREYDADYLQEQIALWELFFAEQGDEIGSCRVSPQLSAVELSNLQEQHMLCLFKFLQVPRLGRLEALNSKGYPDWFQEIAVQKNYLNLPSLSVLTMSRLRGRDVLAEMWPEGFSQWLKNKNLYYRNVKAQLTTLPPFATYDSTAVHDSGSDDRRAFLWRLFDREQKRGLYGRRN